jgi:SAM-dependent methyltransferase
MKILYLLLACSFLHAQNSHETIFTNIYKLGTWDESGFSLSGSQIGVMQKYVEFLQDFLDKNEIHTVVDVGCGDWAFSRYIDWSGIEYLGIDVVKCVIERNQALFTEPNLTFIHGNALAMDLPEADLLICKDVFQHLSNSDIMRLLKQIYKFKHCLFTDYVDPRTLSSRNPDITSGYYHPIDLTKPPFNLQGKKVLTFNAIGAPKQTFHIERIE